MRDEIEFRAYAMSVGIGELSLEQPTGTNAIVDGMRVRVTVEVLE